MVVIPFALVAGKSGVRPCASHAGRPLDTASLAARVLDMAEWARLKGASNHADRLLLAAWALYDDRRVTPRVSVHRRGVAVVCNRPRKVTCINLSETGALLRSRLPLPESATLILNLRGLFGVRAKVLEGGVLARVGFEALSATQETALGSFLGTRMNSSQFIPQLLL